VSETVELLQHLIRAACVNDGGESSGNEERSVGLLQGYFGGAGGAGGDFERFEPTPTRASLVGRVEGSDPAAPTLLYLGHTDVVPANPGQWRHDPFGGELIDGEVWGRGAVDMLNLTSAMAVAFRRVAASGWRPRGTLVYAAVADEEALGTHGADWLVQHATDAVRADYVITESGGIPIPTPGGTRLPVVVGEKGCYWCTLRIRGTAGHASRPFRTDNALVTAAEVVRRIDEHRGPAVINDAWRRFVEGMSMPPEITEMMLDKDRIGDLLDSLPALGLARQAHACTHTTIAPTMMRAGSKTNVIPDVVDLQLDIRTLLGQEAADIEAMLGEILGDLAAKVEVLAVTNDSASASPLDTPLWGVLQKVSDRFHPGAATVPLVTAGATDARFFRRIGAVAYGFGMFSHRITFEQFSDMFHGADEHVDTESVDMSAAMFEAVAREVLA
jgi:acetylornithine deacetylase/succinyl-diaminopimelate desuccinylase-like protein